MKAKRPAKVLSNDHMLDALLEHATDHIYFKNRRGEFMRISRAMARWFGLQNPSRAVGKTDRDYFSPEHAEQAARDEAQILAGGRPVTGKIEKETWPDGRTTWVSTSKLPLRDETGKVIGLFGLSRDVTEAHAAHEELARLAHELQQKNASYENEMKLAEEVFTTYASSAPPVLPPGVDARRAPFHLASHYQAAAAVGGDFLLVMPLGNDKTRLLLCDVMGHGMQAALVAVMLRAWAHDTAPVSPHPQDWLATLNQRLCDAFRDAPTPMMATAVALELNLTTGQITLASAGHPDMFVQTRKRVTRVATTRGPALGIRGKTAYPCEHRKLEPGDKLVLFTDGLTECRNHANRDFDDQGVQDVLARTLGRPGRDVLQALLAAAQAHSGRGTFEDDVCLVVLERRPTSPTRRPSKAKARKPSRTAGARRRG